MAAGDCQLKPWGLQERGALGKAQAPRVQGGGKGGSGRVSGKGEKEARIGTPGGQGGQLGDAGCWLVIGSKFLLWWGYIGWVPPQQETFLEKTDQRGDGKRGKPSRRQQSTTQVGSVDRGEGAWGLRRMAMAVGEMRAGGKETGRKAMYTRRWGQ